MHHRLRRAAFTLTEVMVASTLAGAVMAAVLSSFVFLARNLARVASYQALETEARKTLAYLRQDFGVAERVKIGTTPTATNVTLVLPVGEVTYTFDAAAGSLRRQATFGANQNFVLLRNDGCRCTSFTFDYFTLSDEDPTDQVSPGVAVPYSIKQIEARFVLETPPTQTAETRTRFEAVSSRFLLRNRRPTDGT